MKHFSILALLALLCACSPQSGKVNMNQIDAEESAGNFTKAAYLIDLYIAENDLPAASYVLQTLS